MNLWIFQLGYFLIDNRIVFLSPYDAKFNLMWR
jgi:hypothetical protein